MTPTLAAPTPKTWTPEDLLGMSHVALKAKDPEKSLAFYRDFLGFEEQIRLYEDQGKGPFMLVAVKVSETQSIEIFDGARRPAEDDPMCQIAYIVRDADALRDHLAAAGLRVPEKVMVGQMKNKNLIVRDPSGYAIEFVEYTPEGRTRLDGGKYLGPNRISGHISHAGAVLRADLGAMEKFWKEILGFRQGWKGSKDGISLSWIHFQCGGENADPAFRGARDTLEVMVNPETIPHFCFVVPDMDKAVAALKATAYYQGHPIPLDIKVGINRRRLLNMLDPDGIRVELMEDHTVDGTVTPSSDAPFVPGRG